MSNLEKEKRLLREIDYLIQELKELKKETSELRCALAEAKGLTPRKELPCPAE